MKEGWIVRLKKDFITCDADGATLLVSAGAEGFSGLVKGNKTFGAILELLRNDTSREEIVAAMKARFDAPEEVISRDVTKALAGLRAVGAIEE